MKKMDKFHFKNGLLKELRANAAPVDKKLQRSARAVATKAAKKSKPPKSVLSSLPGSILRRFVTE